MKKFKGEAWAILLPLAILLCFSLSNEQLALAADPSHELNLFTQYKCASCHTIKKLGVAVVKDSAGEEDQEVAGEEGAPDLSSLSDKVMKAKEDPDPAVHLEKYLTKKVPHGTKKHKNRFKGSEDELKKLIQFLLGLHKSK